MRDLGVGIGHSRNNPVIHLAGDPEEQVGKDNTGR
jgi:hypothetical protein